MTDSEAEFLEEQVSGGRHQPTPVTKSPTKLWTHIKATNRDGGLVKEASVCRARLIEPTSEGLELSLVDTRIAPRQPSVPLQPVQPAPQQPSVLFQPVQPVQDLFYKAPQITPSPSHSHEPPWPNLFTTPAFVQEEYDFHGIDFSGLNGNVDSVPIAGPSTTLPAVPHTWIIPPTPIVGDWDTPYPNSIPMDYGSNMVEDDVANMAMDTGEGFMQLEHVIRDVSRNTSIPTHQVIALWHKSNRHSFNNVNHWNAYSSYFKSYPQQELKRLGNC
ncbi:hypothetical protein BDR07DRAFT_1484935 [Suillus spraguei]|nr:hypothetical protein BDR07DRAFT_1484935 [Suillus spraguei]